MHSGFTVSECLRNFDSCASNFVWSLSNFMADVPGEMASLCRSDFMHTISEFFYGRILNNNNLVTNYPF